MITQIEVKKNVNENNLSLLRRFSRKVQDARIVQKIKNERYSERKPSKLSTKKSALKRLERRTEYDKLKKLGKIA